ncbi:MAG: methionyl-tRNA formyltransferase [Gammaproteobacteria bacterium]|nr:methionyl-tRNA formyltransferase [Gammaproteobacteria bacterium]
MQSLRIAYAGTPEFAVPALEAIMHSHHQLVAVITQPDRKSGRGRKISKSAVKQSVTSRNVRVIQPENVNSDEDINELSKLNLDLLVVAAYGQIFSQKLLNLPKMGCLNIHASLLPKWRGASPIQHAILAGDRVSGITIMQMQQAMDAGEIWLQAECPILDNDNAKSLHDKLAKLGGSIILEAINLVSQKATEPKPQDPLLVSYCSKLKKNDGLIDWSESAQLIWRKVRAFHPWPGAYTRFNGRRLRITKAYLAEPITSTKSLPGMVFEASKSGIVVITGKGNLVITELVPEGGKRVSAADFANSNQLKNQKLGETIN